MPQNMHYHSVREEWCHLKEILSQRKTKSSMTNTSVCRSMSSIKRLPWLCPLGFSVCSIHRSVHSPPFQISHHSVNSDIPCLHCKPSSLSQLYTMTSSHSFLPSTSLPPHIAWPQQLSKSTEEESMTPSFTPLKPSCL